MWSAGAEEFSLKHIKRILGRKEQSILQAVVGKKDGVEAWSRNMKVKRM